MKVDFLGEGELPAALEEIMHDSIEISIASAFLNYAGFSMLEKYLKKYKDFKSVQILLDRNFHPDEKVKRELLSRLSRLPNTEVRIFSDENKLFHAKIYFFKGTDKIKAVVGSSNLTGAGLLHNVEINTLFETDLNDPEIIKLEHLYDEYWRGAKSINDLIDTPEDPMGNANFKIGDRVYIGNKIDFGIGVIVAVEGNQVDIFFKERGIAETAHVKDVHLAMEPFDLAKNGNFDDPIKFNLRTKAIYLPIENIRGILSNSIIEILPHQIMAAHKVITSQTRRFLLADEVGLGKTFEAGIIIKEILSRGEATRVLIITPAGLVYQWQEDMVKFGLDFTIYQSGLEASIRDFWNKMNLLIVSIDTIKVEDRLDNFISTSDWDVMVFDEAHHLTRRDYGDKADKSDRYRVAEKLTDKTPSLFFLTATPHQGDTNKFFNLISLLDKNLFLNEHDLMKNRQNLNEIMIRQRKIDITDEEGNPLFVKRIVSALRYEPSEEEHHFFILLTHYLRGGYKIAEQEDSDKRYRALGFVMATFQKIAASSIYAVKKALEERFIRLLFMEIEKSDDPHNVEKIKNEIISCTRYQYDNAYGDEKIFAAAKIAFDKYVAEEKIDPLKFAAAPDEIDLLRNLLSSVPVIDDTKLIKLLDNIKTIKNKEPKEKFIIFTEYLNTQDYIVKKLRAVYGENDVVFIRGGDIQDKIKASKDFKKTAHFLVSTQAGGEGINLQHCHIMINYDMPWNPMKVEQRIGRIHRYKQDDTVQVYNLFAADTIEDRIYQRLDEKLYEITQTIGKEDEREAFRENILGIVAEELNFDDLYKEVLRKGKEVDIITKDKIDEAIERAKEVYEKLGDFTQGLEKFNLEKYFKTKGNISLEEVEKFVLDFVRSEGRKVSIDEEGNYEFICPDIVKTYKGHKYQRASFDREKAVADPSLEFMAIGHPLTDSIIDLCSGYTYGGKCTKRTIMHSEYKGETGIQCNFYVEYQVPVPGQEKNKILQKDLEILVFDLNLKYRSDLKEIVFSESNQKIKEAKEEEFSFANKSYLDNVEKESNKKVQEIIDEKIKGLQTEYPNVIFKKKLVNIALFIVK